VKKSSVSRIRVSWKALKKEGFLILVVLLILVTLSSFALIMVNIYTVRTLSALRATINASSHYAKAQKDGAHHLLMYVGTKKELYFQKYKADLEVYIGDSLALKGLKSGEADSLIASHYIRALNSPSDIDELVWVVKSFRSLDYVKQSLNSWSEGNAQIANLDMLANLIHTRISRNETTPTDIVKWWDHILTVNDNLTIIENNFTDISEEASRLIGKELLVVNIIMTSLIIGATGIYSAISIGKLLKTQVLISEQNSVLTETNKELDQFVYSASHDLRAPLTSMKGLVQLIKHETNPDEIQKFLFLMDETLNMQDEFIHEIIDYSQNNRSRLRIVPINIDQMIDEVFGHLKPKKGTSEVRLEKDLKVVQINSDPLRLRIIFHNLLSNAIKYSNRFSQQSLISVRTKLIGDNVCIEIADNGIGIDPRFHQKIFEMFFVTQQSDRASGVGLYITKESVAKLNGSISVNSEVGRGSSFTVMIPMRGEKEVETIEDETVTPLVMTI